MIAPTSSGGVFDLVRLNARQKELLDKSSQPDFWDKPEQAQAVLKEQDDLRGRAAGYNRIKTLLEEAHLFMTMADEDGADDSEAAREAETVLATAAQEIEAQELKVMLSGEYDRLGAIVSIHPGAGGTEAQDWAEILLRLYLRWAERHGYKVEMADLQPGDGAGIKNATFTVEGDYAYGYLKAESGIHRLVRISPFDANARRHTSFASTSVFPAIDDKVEVNINPADLRIDTYRASGAGGQHVNKTDSAVRMTHLPTGIVVTCQNERSQHKNRAMAMKILRARLFELEERKKREQLEQFSKDQKEIAWGSQIRSYVMQPYQLVKDHRTGLEIGNVNSGLDSAPALRTPSRYASMNLSIFPSSTEFTLPTSRPVRWSLTNW